MKKIYIILLGILLISCVGILIIYDITHPRISAKNQRITIQFATSEEIDEAIIMMALPFRRIKRDTMSGIKRKLQKHSSAIEGKKIKGNTFAFQLPIKSEKYNWFPEQKYDEFATAIIILLKSQTGACTLDITRDKYEYRISRKNIRLKEREDSNKADLGNSANASPEI